MLLTIMQRIQNRRLAPKLVFIYLCLIAHVGFAGDGVPSIQIEHSKSTGFPAISKDKVYVAVLHDEVWYDNTRTFKVLVYATKTSLTEKEFALFSGESTKIAEDIGVSDRVKQAQAFLNKNKFEAMSHVSQDNSHCGMTNQTHFCYKNRQVQVFVDGSLKFRTTLPTKTISGPCCSIDDLTLQCTRTPSPDLVHLSSDNRIGVIQYGFYQGRDGCEDGPYFSVIK